MNDFERAVIEAARAFNADRGMTPASVIPLKAAVERLELHRAQLTAPGLAEVSWAQVAEGDELRGKSGEFYPVLSTKREWKMGKPTGNFVITVKMIQGERELTRPHPNAPAVATVRRGAAGKAVDTFVHVFQSGEL